MSGATCDSILWTFQGRAVEEARVVSGNSIAADSLVTRQWVDCENELKAIRRYRKDWDGMGAQAPDPQLVDNAIRLLAALRRDKTFSVPDAVGASPSGTIVIEWMSEPNMEFEIVPEGIEWFYQTRSGSVHEKRTWNQIEQGQLLRA